MDTSIDYYAYNGRETAQLFEDGMPHIEYYLKHRNNTPVVLARLECAHPCCALPSTMTMTFPKKHIPNTGSK